MSESSGREALTWGQWSEEQRNCGACFRAAASGLARYPWTCWQGHVVTRGGIWFDWPTATGDETGGE